MMDFEGRIHKFLGTVASGGILMPVEVSGNYLATHGMGVLSWVEIFKVIASIYVGILILQALKVDKLILFLFKKFYKIRRVNKLVDKNANKIQ